LTRGKPFQSRPDLQGVKTMLMQHVLLRLALPKQTRSSGGQNLRVYPMPHLKCFQSRPDLQGVKTHLDPPSSPPPPPSKADPIFRGSKLPVDGAIVCHPRLPKQTRSSGGQNAAAIPVARERVPFQSRPDLQGVKTSAAAMASRPMLPKQTRSSGGQNNFADAVDLAALPKQTRSSGGQNRGSPQAAAMRKPSKADPIFRGSKLTLAATRIA